MKRALLYILLFSFILTPVIFAAGVAHVHAGPADMVDVKVTAPSANLSCFGGSIWDMQITINWGMCAASVSYYLLLTPVSWAFGTAGFLLNMIVQELIFRMGAMTGMLEAVTIAWSVMRDIANVLLVFLILFIGIATIVRATSYNSKQLLYRVIIAALLVNFSLYFTKVIIDVTNIFAAQTYIMILKEGLRNAQGVPAMENPEECANSNITKPLNYDSKCFTIGISGAIENLLAINTIYKDTQGVMGNGSAEANEQIGWNIFYVTLLGTILLVVLTFIFLAVIILFITRFVTLVYLMIISPVAFVSLVTGRFGYGKTWWNQIINNAIFAPIYFLLLWVAMLVIRRMMLVYMPGGGSYSSLALAGTSGYTLLIVFMVAAALLIGALMAAKKLGVAGTNMATSVAGGVLFGGAAWMWRNTGGRHFDRKANDKDLLNDAAGRQVWDENLNGGKGGWKNTISRSAQLRAQLKLKTYQKAAKSSGDLRQNLPKGAKSYFESKVGTLGEGHKGGYAAMKKDYVKRHQDFADSLGVDMKRKEELEGRLNGQWEDVKDANGKPVIDPATGQAKQVWKKGITEQISDQQKKVKATQKDIAEQDKELIRMRATAKGHDTTVKEAQKKLSEATTDDEQKNAQKELDSAKKAQSNHAAEIAAQENSLRTKQQELSAHQAEGRALEEQRHHIEEELPRTNRGYVYAENLEKAAKSNMTILGFDTGLKAPGFMAPGGIVVGTNYEQQAAANAIRKKQKAQQKHKSLIDAFHYMKDEGILPEDLEGFDETLMTGTPTPGGSGTTSGTRPTRGTGPSGGTGGPAPTGTGTPSSPAPSGAGGGAAASTAPNTGPAAQAPYRQPGPAQPRPSPSTNIGGTPPQQPGTMFTTSLPNERRGRDGAQGGISNNTGGFTNTTPGERRGGENTTTTPITPTRRAPRTFTSPTPQPIQPEPVTVTPVATNSAPLAAIPSPAPANTVTNAPSSNQAEAAVPAWQEQRAAAATTADTPAQPAPQTPAGWKYDPEKTWAENIETAEASGIGEDQVANVVRNAQREHAASMANMPEEELRAKRKATREKLLAEDYAREDEERRKAEEASRARRQQEAQEQYEANQKEIRRQEEAKKKDQERRAALAIEDRNIAAAKASWDKDPGMQKARADAKARQEAEEKARQEGLAREQEARDRAAEEHKKELMQKMRIVDPKKFDVLQRRGSGANFGLDFKGAHMEGMGEEAYYEMRGREADRLYEIEKLEGERDKLRPEDYAGRAYWDDRIKWVRKGGTY